MLRNIPLVLIVDDAPTNIHTLSTLLKDLCQVKIANNGETALEIARENKPDLILLDIMMPGMDGIATCRGLKENPITSAIPVIFVTAKDSVEDEAIGFELGAVDYIVKPFNPTVVRARVKTHLKLQQLNNYLLDEVARQVKEKMDVQQKLDEQEVLLFQQSKLAAMGEMIGAIAHQWRQPLNALNMHIQNLEDDFEDGLVDREFIETFIEKNRKTIVFMSKTIDDFRNFFRTDKAKYDFSVTEAINETLALQHAQFENNAIKVVVEGPDINLFSLKSEFQQVMLNLINNAKDALIECSIVDKCIQIRLLERSVEVEDNGGGIANDIMERIFEPYFTTKDQGKGMGIGLYMSKMIIEKNMGGVLSVKNTPTGASFCIIFDESSLLK
ncbi:MAG: response regulator [Campylobacteraceae bacterium]|nr:response regulator [Campylobacteraceae bacterium]